LLYDEEKNTFELDSLLAEPPLCEDLALYTFGQTFPYLFKESLKIN